MQTITYDGAIFRVFDHLYAVAEGGELLREGEPITPLIRQDGYFSVGRQRLVHRMVATCWIDRPEGANHVHHKNHNKQDNRASNLEWMTPREHITERHHGISRGHSMSEAGKQKLRELRTGKKSSEATKQKQREANLRLGLKPPPRAVGSKVGADAIAKMRENSPNAMQCQIHGVVYRSYSEAGRALGVKPHTLRQRCLSESFPDYKVWGK
jgi:hypothetical protein